MPTTEQLTLLSEGRRDDHYHFAGILNIRESLSLLLYALFIRQRDPKLLDWPG